MKKKLKANLSLEERCDVLGYRHDAMGKETAESRGYESRSPGTIRRNNEKKKIQRRESKAEWQDFYGGEDLYSGPLGPPEEE